ncbi:MAG: alpha/beta fold hydrolase [Xanthomonadales bacterium]|nr:alpha/beta fold hydrolase [Xanthomonadales bacterium]
MTNRKPPKTLQWGLAGLSLLLAAPALALPEGNSIDFENCTLSMPGVPLTAAARCGFLERPENPDAPDGKRISIHVAVAEASSQTPAADPLFFFAGGPGQAASESWIIMRNSLAEVRKNRDIVLIDQRGTGQSNALRCSNEYRDEALSLDTALDLELLVSQTEECLAQLDGDPRYYTTTIAMQDIDAVRQAMGYEQVNLLGVSYGTRAAQVYLREFPDSVRSVVLDSVVPMQLALGQEHAPMLDKAVRKVLAACAADADCSERYPDQLPQLNALIEELRAQPRAVTMINPVTGLTENVTLSADVLAVAIRFLSYSSENQAMLPLLIHEAVTSGNLERLASQAVLVMGGLIDSLSRGMELSVSCSEDYPYLNTAEDQSDTLLGNQLLQIIAAQCEVWPRGVVPEDFHAAVASDLPVLLLSGERDPVTPPEYATQAAASFSDHLNLVGRGLGHSVLRHRCLQEITTSFIETASTSEPDTTCLETIDGAPFFTSLLGPEP